MPQISRFFGISIYMYYDEHNPPHFHAIYGADEGQIGIAHSLSYAVSFRVVHWRLPSNGLRYIKESCWKIGN